MTVIPVPNHDSDWTDRSGLYSKALQQLRFGISNAAVFNAFVVEVDRGIAAQTS